MRVHVIGSNAIAISSQVARRLVEAAGPETADLGLQVTVVIQCLLGSQN